MLRKTKIFFFIALGTIASFGINGMFVNQANVVAQPETAEEFADVIEGNDTQMIENDTMISNPNNTLLDATEVNIEEDCMTLADGSQYCP